MTGFFVIKFPLVHGVSLSDPWNYTTDVNLNVYMACICVPACMCVYVHACMSAMYMYLYCYYACMMFH